MSGRLMELFWSVLDDFTYICSHVHSSLKWMNEIATSKPSLVMSLLAAERLPNVAGKNIYIENS